MKPYIVAESRRSFRTTLDVPVAVDLAFHDNHQADIVIVADLDLEGAPDPRGRWPAASQWLREQHACGAFICSVCTGAVMLADAGLLEGCEATTHWSAQHLFATYFPKVELKPERVISSAGPESRIVTSGGSASWSDLVLYLVARFNGQAEARRTAKIFLFGDRSDGQLPFTALARPRQHDDAIVADSQSWIAEHYAISHPVNRMVEHSRLAQRTFKRRFASATGYAPLIYVQALRVERAKQMLESGDEPIDDIAWKVGYEDPNSLRRLFKRSTGITPSRYRKRFQTISTIEL